MKRLILALGFLALAPAAHAVDSIFVAPFGFFGTPTLVSCSTYSWTQVDSAPSNTSSAYGSPARAGVWINNPTTNTSTLDFSPSASISTTTLPMQLEKGEQFQPFWLEQNEHLYCHSQNTSAENVVVTPLRQKL